MALSTDPGPKLYRYSDLATFPDDNLRREIIDGELIVTAAPATRHQRAVGNVFFHLEAYCRRSGGQVFPAPTDVYLDDFNVVEPDVLWVASEHIEQVEEKFVRGRPDVVVEVSSPSTRRLELVRKRELYARFGVPEYWYVDLEVDRVEIYRLEAGAFGAPSLKTLGEILESPLLPGFSMPVAEALGYEPDREAE